MDLLRQALENPLVNLVSIVLAVTSIALAYIFYRRSRRSKEPCWSIRNSVLVEGYISKLGGLDIQYKGEKVENLSIARIALWNQGSETIDGRDIASADPLRIETSNDAEILDATMLFTNRDSIQFRVEQDSDRKSAVLSFDYLDRGLGAVVQVVHTGTKSADLSVIGDLKGANRLSKKSIRVVKGLPFPTPKSFGDKVRPSTRRRIMAAFLIVLAVIFLSQLCFELSQKPVADVEWLSILFVGFYFIGFTVFACLHLRSSLPSGLEAFEDEPLL